MKTAKDYRVVCHGTGHLDSLQIPDSLSDSAPCDTEPDSRFHAVESGTMRAIPICMNANNGAQMKTDSLKRDDMQNAVATKKVPKTSKMYSVRRYLGGGSEPVGFKMRLMPRLDALAVVRFLKARGVDAYAAPLSVTR